MAGLAFRVRLFLLTHKGLVAGLSSVLIIGLAVLAASLWLLDRREVVSVQRAEVLRMVRMPRLRVFYHEGPHPWTIAVRLEEGEETNMKMFYLPSDGDVICVATVRDGLGRIVYEQWPATERPDDGLPICESLPD